MLMGWTRRSKGNAAAHYAERSDAWGGASAETVDMGYAEGIASGTLIATDKGWRPVQMLAVGDMVLTFDNGGERVLEVSRRVLWRGQGVCPRALWPLAVPAGVLGNRRAMLLLPDQNVMIESDLAEVLFGDPFALLPAAALQGYFGITRVCPHGTIEVVAIRFAEDQVVYANGSGMLHCGSITGLGLTVDFVVNAGNYLPLSLDRAQKLVALMAEEEAETQRHPAFC